jgi:hypothetical protein
MHRVLYYILFRKRDKYYVIQIQNQEEFKYCNYFPSCPSSNLPQTPTNPIHMQSIFHPAGARGREEKNLLYRFHKYSRLDLWHRILAQSLIELQQYLQLFKFLKREPMVHLNTNKNVIVK